MNALDILGDPVRRRLIELLAPGEITAGELTSVIQQELASLSQQCLNTCVYCVNLDSQPCSPREREGSMRSRRTRLRKSMFGWITYERTGSQSSMHLAPKSPAANERGNQKMIDNTTQIKAVVREVEDRDFKDKPAKVIVLSQTYSTNITDLWDAITNPDRLPRWFAPVTGELQLNGRFQIENNASGTLTARQPPRSFDATWEFGEATSWIEVRLNEINSAHSQLELAHIAYPDEHWDQFGPGAGGIGWDLALLGLATHLATGDNIHESNAEWAESDAAIDFMQQSGTAWTTADIAGGENESVAQQRGQNTINFYTGAE